MKDDCICGECGDDLPIGQVMMMATEENNGRHRAKILNLDFALGPEPDPEILWTGTWLPTMAKAEREGLYRYWPIYEFKNGFKHPQDPRGLRDDGPPVGTVVFSMGLGDEPEPAGGQSPR